MERAELKTLLDNKLALNVVQSLVSFECGSPFKVAVNLSNSGRHAIAWPASGNSLNIAYRWFDAAGDCVESDGPRTHLQSPLPAHSSVEMIVAGRAPADPGRYELVVSLLLENVHWASDVADGGWTRIPVLVERPAAWPAALRTSPAGRALRGALAAAEIERGLQAEPFDVAGIQAPAPIQASPAIEVAAATPVALPAAAPVEIVDRVPARTFLVRLRAWFRHFFGLPEMRSAIEELLKRSADQHAQMNLLLHEQGTILRQAHRLDQKLDKLLQHSALQQGALEDATEERANLDARLSDLSDALALVRTDIRQARSRSDAQREKLIAGLDTFHGKLTDLRARHDKLSLTAESIGKALKENRLSADAGFEGSRQALQAMPLQLTKAIRDLIGAQEAALLSALGKSDAALRENVDAASANVMNALAERLGRLQPMLQELAATSARQTDEALAQRFAAANALVSETAGRLHDELNRSSREVIAAFSRGQVVDELILGIRQSLELLMSLERAVSDRKDDETIEASARMLNRLASTNDRQIEKLDTLLTREVIPVAAANLLLIRNPLGLLAIQDNDAAAIAYYSNGQLPEPGTVAVVQNLLKPGETFLDVGANVGAYTLLAARLVGPGGTVISVEPVPVTAAMLRTTAAINGISAQTEIHECALGEQDGSSSITLGTTSGHSSFRPLDGGAATESVLVPVRRGADVVGDRVPAIVKIDVEGFELEVLSGLQPVLANKTSALIVEYSPQHIEAAGLTAAQWLKRLRQYRSQIWIIGDDPVGLTPLPPQKIPEGATNLFCCDKLPGSLRSLAVAVTRA